MNKRIIFSATAEMDDELKRIAKERKISESAVIRYAIMLYLVSQDVKENMNKHNTEEHKEELKEC